MTAREEAIELLRQAPDQVVGKVLELLRLLTGQRAADGTGTAFASENVLARDWSTPEEDQAWKDL